MGGVNIMEYEIEELTNEIFPEEEESPVLVYPEKLAQDWFKGHKASSHDEIISSVVEIYTSLDFHPCEVDEFEDEIYDLVGEDEDSPILSTVEEAALYYYGKKKEA